MKRKIKNCGECKLRKGNICDGITIEDLNVIQDWCNFKDQIYTFDNEKVAIIEKDGVVEGYLKVVTGDEPYQYLELMKQEDKVSVWSYTIINKIDY